MSINDETFNRKLLESFKEEAAEHLKSLSDGLLSLEKKGAVDGDEPLLREMFRAAHSLKGSARAVNFLGITGICQVVEDVFAALKNNDITLCRGLVDTLVDSFDAIEGLIFAEEEGGTNPDIDSLIVRLRSFWHSSDLKEPKSEEKEKKQKSVGKKPSLSPVEKRGTVRVATGKIDNLMQNVEELLAIKMGFGEKVRELRAIFGGLGRFLDETEQSGKSVDDHFLTELRKFVVRGLELNGSWEQGYKSAGSMIDAVLESSKEILLEPISTILDRFPRIVRDLSRSLGKEVELAVKGDDIEVDRRILENLSAPLIHVVRNSIDHGIEFGDERVGAGKDRSGKIDITVSYEEGSSFKLIIRDDGRGANLDKVRKKIVEEGLAGGRNVEDLSDDELLRYLFRPGFTTSDIVTEISGRGVGLDVVAENIEKLGGSVTLSSSEGKGTAVTIIVPLTMATFRGILVEVANREFILPTERIVRSVSIDSSGIRSVEGNLTVTIDGEVYPYARLCDLLELSSGRNDNGTINLVLLKAQWITIALGVDRIIKEDEVHIKPLGYPLVRIRNIAAATIVEGGKIVLVLNPFDLARTASAFKKGISSDVKPPERREEKEASILLVEDSATTRMLLKNILEVSRFKVRTAVNGSDALEIMREEDFDLVLSDVEMPYLDGFQLTEEIKKSARWRDIPVVLCTTRGSKEDKERGVEVGASAYIEKSGFSESFLIDIIRQLVCGVDEKN